MSAGRTRRREITERFDEVDGLISRAGYDCQRRTKLKGTIKDVLLLDTIGELRSFYGICDIAFVGGSLVKVGGHNLLEPAMMKKRPQRGRSDTARRPRCQVGPRSRQSQGSGDPPTAPSIVSP